MSHGFKWSTYSYDALRLPERNRAERRAKYRALRRVVRSRFAQRHGVPCDDIPPAHVAELLRCAQRTTYTARLRDYAPVFLRRFDSEDGITETRADAARMIRG